MQKYSGDEDAILDNMDKLEKVCKLLGLDASEMKAAFTSSLSVLKGLSPSYFVYFSSLTLNHTGETIIVPYKPFKAEDVRDATAKGIYGRTFSFVPVHIFTCPMDSLTCQQLDRVSRQYPAGPQDKGPGPQGQKDWHPRHFRLRVL